MFIPESTALDTAKHDLETAEQALLEAQSEYAAIGPKLNLLRVAALKELSATQRAELRALMDRQLRERLQLTRNLCADHTICKQNAHSQIKDSKKHIRNLQARIRALQSARAKTDRVRLRLTES